MPKPFVPNGATLETMMRNAMARFDADREQALLVAERRVDQRIERAAAAEVTARNRKFWSQS
jgi:hypothetical protein